MSQRGCGREPPLRIPEGARAEWNRLDAALLDITVPCSAAPNDWFSSDTATRQHAERACIACPVIALCSAYASAAAETDGVWAGHDRSTTQHRATSGIIFRDPGRAQNQRTK